jgi:hypothetical protein
MQRRCIALYSGGLDSILSIRLIQGQGIEVIPLYFCTPFFGFEALRDPLTFRRVHEERYGITVRVIDYTETMIRIVSSPAHGYGKNLNPCIDCKIGMLRHAKDLLETLDASFVVTGEVLGQRPMSQLRQTMRRIEKESGLKDILLRPLCAKLLPVTLPERLGVVRREGLWDIAGRGRKVQIERALAFGISGDDLPTPAGGCLLTDKQISLRVRKTYERFRPGIPGVADLTLDIAGRKFMLDSGTVLVIGRDEKENDLLATFVCPGNVFMRLREIPGPLCIVRGGITEDKVCLAAGICLRYTKARGQEGHTAVWGDDPSHLDRTVQAPAFSEEYCDSFRD